MTFFFDIPILARIGEVVQCCTALHDGTDQNETDQTNALFEKQNRQTKQTKKDIHVSSIDRNISIMGRLNSRLFAGCVATALIACAVRAGDFVRNIASENNNPGQMWKIGAPWNGPRSRITSQMSSRGRTASA